MSARCLPIECLGLIFAILLKDSGTHTLSTLLRVSKDIQAIALPLLYNDPFKFFNPPPRYQPRRQQQQARLSSANAVALIKLLLRCVSSGLSQDIRVGYGTIQPRPQSCDTGDSTEVLQLFPSEADEQCPPSIDYLDLVRRVHIGRRDLGIPSDFEKIRAYYLGLDGEARSKLEKENPSFLFVQVFNHLDAYNSCRRLENLTKEVIWALFCDRLEQFQSITIFIDDIQRYLQVVHSFNSLISVHIEYGGTTRIYLSEKGKEALLEKVVLFVQQHTSLFGALQDVNFPDCPIQFQRPLWSAMPKLVRPKTIDITNWSRFLANSESVDCTHIESICMPLRTHLVLSSSVLTRSSPYLKNCRSLQRYEMPFIGSELDSFQFAVIEKNNAGFSLEHPNNVFVQNRRNNTEPRLMVKHIKIRSIIKTLDSRLDQVSYAFSESLQTLEATVQSPNLTRSIVSPTSPQLPGLIGKHWSLPCLQRLDIQEQSQGLLLDTRLLSNCPLLEELSLIDIAVYPKNFEFHAIPLQEPFYLPKLKKLKLEGLSALGFHPDTLRWLPKLEILSLKTNFTTEPRGFSIIRSPVHTPLWMTNPDDPSTPQFLERLRDTTTWSWDWHLPLLATLELYGEFAMSFPLQALQRMPLVHTLHLHTGTHFNASCSLRRQMNLSEFTVGDPPYHTCKNTEPNLPSQVFSLPRLQNFYVGGSWELDCEALKSVFSLVMPNLRCISEAMVSSITIPEWIQTTFVLEHLLVARSAMMHPTISEVVKEFNFQRDYTARSHFRPFEQPSWPGVEEQREMQRQETVKYNFGNDKFIRTKE
ncbi:hypothetical protein BGZ80_000236 [Entomortierella chlamydospora]|uniref:F-box domain-containing protein n=1 Tax=Entomortierella chlamydospora TaxID=101097 RepID=A0A9P6MTN1_9FUNG|nr:hypothetical protein BGZ79_008779 [Entomortierella chlamydospora]KAG0012057.1 hypothetical protein BGZ80_000236 [Entomortierella chlamydospora]